MNMNPDEATLALWLDDELTGPEKAVVEAWASQHPDQLAAREEIIVRLLKSVEMHDLDDAQMVAVTIHAAAAGWSAPAIY